MRNRPVFAAVVASMILGISMPSGQRHPQVRHPTQRQAAPMTYASFLRPSWISRIDAADPSYVGGTGLIFPVLFFFMALANGATQKFIANRYGTTEANLHHWMKKRGLKRVSA